MDEVSSGDLTLIRKPEVTVMYCELATHCGPQRPGSERGDRYSRKRMIDAEAAVVVVGARMPAPLEGEREREGSCAGRFRSDRRFEDFMGRELSRASQVFVLGAWRSERL